MLRLAKNELSVLLNVLTYHDVNVTSLRKFVLLNLYTDYIHIIRSNDYYYYLYV
jgi:hypothetical protein